MGVCLLSQTTQVHVPVPSPPPSPPRGWESTGSSAQWAGALLGQQRRAGCPHGRPLAEQHTLVLRQPSGPSLLFSNWAGTATGRPLSRDTPWCADTSSARPLPPVAAPSSHVSGPVSPSGPGAPATVQIRMRPHAGCPAGDAGRPHGLPRAGVQPHLLRGFLAVRGGFTAASPHRRHVAKKTTVPKTIWPQAPESHWNKGAQPPVATRASSPRTWSFRARSSRGLSELRLVPPAGLSASLGTPPPPDPTPPVRRLAGTAGSVSTSGAAGARPGVVQAEQRAKYPNSEEHELEGQGHAGGQRRAVSLESVLTAFQLLFDVISVTTGRLTFESFLSLVRTHDSLLVR